jgi:hypothetical protein
MCNMAEQMQLLEQWGKLTSEENLRDGGRLTVCAREKLHIARSPPPRMLSAAIE